MNFQSEGPPIFSAIRRRCFETNQPAKHTPSNKAAVLQRPSTIETSLYWNFPSLMVLHSIRYLSFWKSFDGTNNRVAFQYSFVSHDMKKKYLEEHDANFSTTVLCGMGLKRQWISSCRWKSCLYFGGSLVHRRMWLVWIWNYWRMRYSRGAVTTMGHLCCWPFHSLLHISQWQVSNTGNAHTVFRNVSARIVTLDPCHSKHFEAETNK